MNRRIKLVFTASVLLNIVLLGIGLGILYRACQGAPIPGNASPEARNFLARTFQSGREEIKPLIAEVKERRKAVETILTADTFDRLAYDKAVADMMDTQVKIMHQRADTMGKALNDLSTEDRQKFSNLILEGLTPGRPRKPGGHRGMRDGGKDGAKPALESPDKRLPKDRSE